MKNRAEFTGTTKRPPPLCLPLHLWSAAFSPPAKQGACAQKKAWRQHHLIFSAVAGILLLIFLSAPVMSSPWVDSMPKIVRKSWGKPSRAFLHDTYGTFASPLLRMLAKKAQRIGNRLLHADYHTLGSAWFNAFLIDMSEYILHRSTCAGLDEELSENASPNPPADARRHSGTHWSTQSSRIADSAYLPPDVLARLRPAKSSASRAPVTAVPAEEYPPNEEGSSSSNQVVKLNMSAIVRWKESFEGIFMSVAKQILPQNILELVRSMDENQYSDLRPTLEHALYRSLTEFYPTLMSTEISEAILPNFHVAVSCETCPFSLYTSYTFMALIAAGRSGVDGLFLADEMLQHYKNDKPYISPECKAFNENMTDALMLNSMTLHELVSRTAGAACSSFYSLPSLVSLQSETLLGTHTRLKSIDEKGPKTSAEGVKDEDALRKMVEAFGFQQKSDYSEQGQHALSPRFILEMSKNVKAASQSPRVTTTKSAGGITRHYATNPDPLASLVLRGRSDALGDGKG